MDIAIILHFSGSFHYKHRIAITLHYSGSSPVLEVGRLSAPSKVQSLKYLSNSRLFDINLRINIYNQCIFKGLVIEISYLTAGYYLLFDMDLSKTYPMPHQRSLP